MKYIIEVQPIPGTNLYKAKNFNTLVFDQTGLDKLEKVNPKEIRQGDIIRDKSCSDEWGNFWKVQDYVYEDNKVVGYNCIRATHELKICKYIKEYDAESIFFHQ